MCFFTFYINSTQIENGMRKSNVISMRDTVPCASPHSVATEITGKSYEFMYNKL